MIQAYVRIVVPQEKRAELLDVLQCLKGPTEVARGCQAYHILQDADDENSLTYLVLWDSQEALEEHIRSERFRRLLPYIEMSTEPPEVSVNTVDPVGGIEFLVAVLGSSAT